MMQPKFLSTLVLILTSQGMTEGASIHWNSWTTWSACTDACSPQLVSRIRTCIDTVSSAAACTSTQKQYKVCNRTACQDGKVIDVRQEECAHQRQVVFRGRRYYWDKHIDPRKRCEVTCKASRYGFIHSFGRRVKDGVACNDQDSQDQRICLHGTCQAVGCDGVVGSGLTIDHCGVCGGDNNSCKIIKGIYMRSHLNYGYNQITRIPEGACHINVTELDRSRNYLVVKYSNGTGIINGDRQHMKHPGQYQAAGTMFTYSKQTGQGCPGECLYAPGPLTSYVDIQLLTYRKNPGVSYMFTIQEDVMDNVLKTLNVTTQQRHSLYPKGHNEGQGHTRTEGHHRQRGHTIQQSNQGSNSGSTNHQSEMYNQEPAYVNPKYRTASANQNQALESGSHGYRYVDSKNRYGGLTDSASNTFDGDSIAYVNGQTERIQSDGINKQSDRNNADNSNSIPNSDYRKLSNQIGYDSDNKGQSSSYNSYNLDNSYMGMANKRNDLGTGYSVGRQKPKLTIANTVDEVNFHWVIMGFTNCTEPCGGGTQDTVVKCMKKKTNVVVTNDNCNQEKINIQTVPCNKQPCPPKWTDEPWSVCSVSCGEGVQTRTVECKARYSEKMSITVSASQCEGNKPITSRSCEVQPCADWRTGNWSKCSVVCGIGESRRPVDCMDTEGTVVNDTQCTRTKPRDTKLCDMGTCAQGWFLTKWSSRCSTQCGRGHVYRTAYCLASDGSRLPEVKCGKKPRTRKSCKKTITCGGFWFEGPWTPCSATCGPSTQTREVVCIKKVNRKLMAVVGAENCKEHTRPETVRDCAKQPECPAQWFITTWSKCSKSCGTGIKTRDMKCLSPDTSPSSQCTADRKPSFRRTCNTQDCYLPQLDEDPNCKDSGTLCQFVIQSDLCIHEFYRNLCCHSCTLHELKKKLDIDPTSGRSL